MARRQANETPKQLLISAIVGFGMLGLVMLAAKTGLIHHAMQGLFAPLAPKDASGIAERRADRLQDSPDCAQYKQALRDAGKGPPASAGVMLRIQQIYDQAAKAGCEKTP